MIEIYLAITAAATAIAWSLQAFDPSYRGDRIMQLFVITIGVCLSVLAYVLIEVGL